MGKYCALAGTPRGAGGFSNGVPGSPRLTQMAPLSSVVPDDVTWAFFSSITYVCFGEPLITFRSNKDLLQTVPLFV